MKPTPVPAKRLARWGLTPTGRALLDQVFPVPKETLLAKNRVLVAGATGSLGLKIVGEVPTLEEATRRYARDKKLT